MKKQIIINGAAVVVSTPEELKALNLTIAQSVEAFNDLAAGINAPEVKKFSDKTVASKRLFGALPEYVAPKALPVATATPAVAPKPASDKPKGVKAVLRRLYSDPAAAFTGAELETATNASYKVLHDDLARLKHPTYAGKAGTLTIVRIGKLYVLAGSAKEEELLEALAKEDAKAADVAPK